MAKYIVLSAKPYDFVNDRQERVQGLKLSYINPKAKQENVMGFEPILASVPVEFEKSLVEVPGAYNMEFEVVTGSKNRAQLQLTEIEFIEAVGF